MALSQQATLSLELQMHQAAMMGGGIGRLAGAGIAFATKKTFWGAIVGVWAGGFVGSLVAVGYKVATHPGQGQTAQPAPSVTQGLGAALRGSLGIGNAPAQVQEWGKRGMHLGPYHESSTHGDSPFLFGPEHYHQITEPGRTQKDYLTGPERMSAEAWKDGRKSWVDITPQGGPKMRVTHQIFGGERGAGY